MNGNVSEARKFGTRQIVMVGMLSAVSVVLGLTGLGYIPLILIKATIMHIPVIIGAILEGPLVGAAIGLIFGLSSIMQNIVSPSILSPALMNPVVSVLPRILIGITSYYSYKLVTSKHESVKIGVGAAVGSLTNTIGVLGMIYVFYAPIFAQSRHISIGATLKVILGIALTNGLLEAVVAVIITMAVVLAVKKIKR